MKYFFKEKISRPFFLLVFCGLSTFVYSQSYYFGSTAVKWDLRKTFTIPAEAANYSGSDLVILSDLTEFFFNSAGHDKVARSLKYKINTQKGLDQLKHYTMPESFDYAFDSELYKQSRRARISIPVIKDYKIKVFAARKFSREKWSNVSVKDFYETLRWIKSTGEFSDEEILVFHLGTMAVGDVVEIYYESEFDTRYGANVFYFNGPYPKLKCEYDFIFRQSKASKETSFILPVNVKETNITSSHVNYTDYLLVTTRIQLSDLKANNYPTNSFEAAKLPHVYADFSYYRSLVKYVDNEYSFSKATRPKNFEWLVLHDTTTTHNQHKTYDKQFATIRKFTATLPPVGTDSQNVVFFRALCDSFNNFRYLNANHLFYNESNLYELYSVDHVLKRRLPGHTLWKLYTDVLKDNNLFYYLVNVQDKRFGEHDPRYRVHHAYEHELLALPLNNSYSYFMPRYAGVKYHANELPFYFEGALASLTPMNFQAETKNKETKAFKMIKMRGSNFSENTRAEEASIKVVVDSLTARFTIKESLSGQYSTLLRHHYLNECIDSTVSPHYFRKCTDKPRAGAHKIKLVSKNSEFPYRYEFNCSAKLNYNDSTKLSLKNWFSFTLSKALITQAPNHDYYFDFSQSDNYRFMFDFNKAVNIKNKDTFTKKIDNDYFSLESGIFQNSASNYTVRASFIIKQNSIPVDKVNLLMEIVEQLDQLNNITLEIARK